MTGCYVPARVATAFQQAPFCLDLHTKRAIGLSNCSIPTTGFNPSGCSNCQIQLFFCIVSDGKNEAVDYFISQKKPQTNARRSSDIVAFVYFTLRSLFMGGYVARYIPYIDLNHLYNFRQICKCRYKPDTIMHYICSGKVPNQRIYLHSIFVV